MNSRSLIAGKSGGNSRVAKAVVRVLERWRCSDVEGVGRRRGKRRRRALVALGEEPERVDLVDEIGHARPPAEPEPNHQHPPNALLWDHQMLRGSRLCLTFSPPFCDIVPT